MGKKEIKMERSVPVQGRVDLVELANVAAFSMRENMHLWTLSSILSLAVDIASAAIENTVGERKFDNIADAYRFMETNGFMRGKVAERGRKKALAAMRFEVLRSEGDDPSLHAPTQYNMLHNENSISVPSEGKVAEIQEAMRIWKRVMKQHEESEIEARSKEALAKQKAMVDENGVVQLPDKEEIVLHEQTEEQKAELEERKRQFYENRARGEQKIKEQREKERIAELSRKKAEKEIAKANAILAKHGVECAIKNDDRARPMTEDELARKAKEIEERDIALANMDMSPGHAPVKDNEFVK